MTSRYPQAAWSEDMCYVRAHNEVFLVVYRGRQVVRTPTLQDAIRCGRALVAASQPPALLERCCTHCASVFPLRRLCRVRGVGRLCPGCYYCWRYGVPQNKA